MLLYLFLLQILANTESLATSHGENNFQTKIETLEMKQELVTTASKLLHEDMLLIQRAMKNFHQINVEQIEDFSNELRNSNVLQENASNTIMNSILADLTNIMRQQEKHETQIQTLTETTVHNMTIMATSLTDIQTQLADIIYYQYNLDNQLRKMSNVTPTTQDPVKECPEGWKRYQGHCFLFPGERRSWTQAKEYCIVRNSSLVMILNEDMNSYISNEMRGIRWIGLNDRMTAGTWVWDTLTGDVPLLFDNWAPGKPSGLSGCAIISSDDRWYPARCRGNFPFVCEFILS